MNTIDDELAADLARMRDRAERSASVEMGTDAARLRVEIQDLRRAISAGACALRSALELARAPQLEHEAALALLDADLWGGEWTGPGDPPDYAPRRFSDWFPLWDLCIDGKLRPSRVGKRLTDIYAALRVLEREAKEHPCR
jgi:hypothetical protein